MRARTAVALLGLSLQTACGGAQKATDGRAAGGDASPGCGRADALRAGVPALVDEGRLDRALRTLDRADALCPAGAARARPWVAQVLVGLGETTRAAQTIAAAKGDASLPASERARVAEAERALAEDARVLGPRGEARFEAARGAIARAGGVVGRGERRAIDRALHEIEAETGQRAALDALDGVAESVEALAFATDGKTLALAHGAEVSLVDVASRRERLRLRGPSKRLLGLAVSPDGKTVAAGDVDARVRLWDVTGAAPGAMRTLEGHLDSVERVAFSPDGASLASSSHDKTVRLWDVATGRPIATLEGHREVVFGIAFAPDGKTIASVSFDRTARLWDLHGKALRVFEGHGDSIEALAFAPDGKALATASRDRSVRLWDVGGAAPRTLGRAEEPLLAVAFAPDGKTVVAGGLDGRLRGWDVATGKPAIDRPMGSGVRALAYAPDGATLAVHRDGGVTSLLDPAGASRATIEPVAWGFGAVAFAPDGEALAAAGHDGEVRVFGGEPTLRSFTAHEKELTSVAWSPDGKALVTGSDDETARLWDASGSPRATLRGHGREVTAVAWSPDGETIASASHDRSVRLWARDGRLRASLFGHENEVYAVAFAPDGTLASASYDQTVRLWSRDGKPLRTLKGHGATVRALAWSPGSALASASADRTVRLWGLDGGALRTLEGHEDYVNAVAFAPAQSGDAGGLLASGDSAGVVRLFRTDGAPIRAVPLPLPRVASVSVARGARLVAAAGRRIVLLDVERTRTLSLRALAPRARGGEPTAVRSGGYVWTDAAIDFVGSDARAARDFVSCRLGARVLPFELCAERFERPGLLSAFVHGEPLDALE